MKISEAFFVFVDTETGGTNAESDDLLEVSASLVDGATWHTWATFETFVRTTQPISPVASGVHGITTTDCQTAPKRADVDRALRAFVPSNAIVVAHNAEFDRGFLPSLANNRWCCSMRLAQRVKAEAPDFKLGTLRYVYNLYNIDLGGSHAHRAGADVAVLQVLFRYLVADYLGAGHPDGVEAFVEFANTITHYPMRKHRGKLLTEVPHNDLQYWLFRADEPIKGDLREAFLAELRRRGIAA